MPNYEYDPFEGEYKVNECKWCYAPCENDFCCEECAKNWINE